MIMFIYKNGFTDKRDGGRLRTPRNGRQGFDVEPDEIAYPLPQSGPFNPCSSTNVETYRDVGGIIPQKPDSHIEVKIDFDNTYFDKSAIAERADKRKPKDKPTYKYIQD